MYDKGSGSFTLFVKSLYFRVKAGARLRERKHARILSCEGSCVSVQTSNKQGICHKEKVKEVLKMRVWRGASRPPARPPSCMAPEDKMVERLCCPSLLHTSSSVPGSWSLFYLLLEDFCGSDLSLSPLLSSLSFLFLASPDFLSVASPFSLLPLLAFFSLCLFLLPLTSCLSSFSPTLPPFLPFPFVSPYFLFTHLS